MQFSCVSTDAAKHSLQVTNCEGAITILVGVLDSKYPDVSACNLKRIAKGKQLLFSFEDSEILLKGFVAFLGFESFWWSKKGRELESADGEALVRKPLVFTE